MSGFDMTGRVLIRFPHIQRRCTADDVSFGVVCIDQVDLPDLSPRSRPGLHSTIEPTCELLIADEQRFIDYSIDVEAVGDEKKTCDPRNKPAEPNGVRI